MMKKDTEYRIIFMQQSRALNDLLAELSKMSDEKRNEIVDSISNEEFEKKYGIIPFDDNVLKSRLSVVETVILLLFDCGYERCDLVLWSYLNSIIERLDKILHFDGEEK